MSAKVSVILSFFNKIEVLKLVLESLALQSKRNFEVIIADDGSKQDVVAEIKLIMNGYPFQLKHCWHADNGWQKNRILNRAANEANGDVLIFVDADCLLHKYFVSEHQKRSKEKIILAGRRVDLSKRITKKLSVKRLKTGYLDNRILFDLLWDLPFGKSKHVEQSFYIGNSKFSKWLNRKRKGLLGSNFSLCSADFYDVNGFDERFNEPAAGEDTDIERRLLRNGCSIKTVRNRAIQYHIHHEKLPRNESRFKYLYENDQTQVTYTAHGITKKL